MCAISGVFMQGLVGMVACLAKHKKSPTVRFALATISAFFAADRAFLAILAEVLAEVVTLNDATTWSAKYSHSPRINWHEVALMLKGGLKFILGIDLPSPSPCVLIMIVTLSLSLWTKKSNQDASKAGSLAFVPIPSRLHVPCSLPGPRKHKQSHLLLSNNR